MENFDVYKDISRQNKIHLIILKYNICFTIVKNVLIRKKAVFINGKFLFVPGHNYFYNKSRFAED